LAAAIVDAGKAERAAEALRTAATCSAKITEHEKTTPIIEAMSSLEEAEIGQF